MDLILQVERSAAPPFEREGTVGSPTSAAADEANDHRPHGRGEQEPAAWRYDGHATLNNITEGGSGANHGCGGGVSKRVGAAAGRGDLERGPSRGRFVDTKAWALPTARWSRRQPSGPAPAPRAGYAVALLKRRGNGERRQPNVVALTPGWG